MRDELPFKLLGEPMFVVDGQSLAAADSDALLAGLGEGIQSHGAVAALWASWQGA
jgi:hypothetical protein